MSAGHFEMALRSTGLKAAQSLSSVGNEGRETLEPIYHDLPQCPPPAAHAASTLPSKSVDLFKYDRQRCCGDGGGSNFTPSKDDDSARKVKRLKIARGTASLG